MSIEDRYPFDINLEDSWFAYDIQKFNEVRNNYQVALRELNNIECEQGKPVAVKSFVLNYYRDGDPHYLAGFWKEIVDYIDSKESDTWKFSSLEDEVIDVNDDPYVDYEMLTTKYTVYAILSGDKPNPEETEEYMAQLSLVDYYHKELMQIKASLDRKLKGE